MRPEHDVERASGPRQANQPTVLSAVRRQQTLVLIVVMLGVSMAAIDTTIVVLSLPVMMVDLHSDIVTMVWVIMAYLLTLTILGTQVGRLGDMYGRVRMYNLGFAIFTLGSVLCGLAQSGPELIGLRVIQGIGGALISANSGAIIADNVPVSERGRAYGWTSIGFNVGAILGILLGGVLITFVNWRFIFYINLPIGLIALVLAYLVLRERSPHRRETIDVLGMALLGVGLLLVLLSLTNIAGLGWSTLNGILLAIGVVSIGVFLVWENQTSAPLLALSLFHRRVLTASIFAAFFQALGNFAVLFLVTMYLQGVRGLSPFAASLLLIPGYAVGGVIGPWSGRLADRLGARIPASVGLGFQIAGVLLYSTLGLTTPYWVVIFAAILSGVGSGFFFPANNSAVMANAPTDAYGIASGLLRTLANVGMVGSFAVVLLAASAAVSRQEAFQIFLGTSVLTPALAAAFVRGLHLALLITVIPLAIAVVLSVLRGQEVRGGA
ncbi:MAG TPA: MFS transporter [Chloroflexota bacterium]|nr:MFS transporter [Chloroflexota bacterium]